MAGIPSSLMLSLLAAMEDYCFFWGVSLAMSSLATATPRHCSSARSFANWICKSCSASFNAAAAAIAAR